MASYVAPDLVQFYNKLIICVMNKIYPKHKILCLPMMLKAQDC